MDGKHNKHNEQFIFEIYVLCSKTNFSDWKNNPKRIIVQTHIKTVSKQIDKLKIQHWSILTSTFKFNWKRNAMTCENRNACSLQVYRCFGWMFMPRAFRVSRCDKGFSREVEKQQFATWMNKIAKPDLVPCYSKKQFRRRGFVAKLENQSLEQSPWGVA